jgi:predicted PurR-regulated permease PerM
MDSKKIETSFFIALLLVVLFTAFFIYLPFLNVVVLALTFFIIFRPFYNKLLKIFRQSRPLAAITTIVVVCVVIIAPLIFLSFQIFGEAKQIYFSIINSNGVFLEKISSSTQESFQKIIPNFSFDLNEYAKQTISWFIQNIGLILSSLVNVFFTFFLSLFAFYYLLKDGDELKRYLVAVIPFSSKDAGIIFDKLHLMASSVIRGSLIMAIIQGIILGVGFFIFGVPQAAFWGAVGVIAALIPLIGIYLIIAPAAAYLFILGNVFPAIGLILWGIIIGGGVSFFFPYLIKQKAKIHPFLILLSVLGGLIIFGPTGFIIGPLILSLLFALLSIYPVLILKREEIN